LLAIGNAQRAGEFPVHRRTDQPKSGNLERRQDVCETILFGAFASGDRERSAARVNPAVAMASTPSIAAST